MHIKKMVNPPKVPQDEIDRFNKLTKERQERFEFLAKYPEYLIDKNREDLLQGINEIRKDFQENTRQIAEELSKSSSRTAWKIAIFSLFGGFVLGLLSALIVPWVFQITNIKMDESANTTKIVSPALQPKEKAETPKSE